MEKYIVIIVMVVGLVGLFSFVNSTSLTGMVPQNYKFFSERICGSPEMVPLISKVATPGKGGHTYIYGCIPKDEQVIVGASKFDFNQRQQMKRLKDYWYITKPPIRN